MYYKHRMNNNADRLMVKRFVNKCISLDMNLEQMGAAVGRTRGWASQLINERIKNPRWRTRNRIARFLGEA